jgi:hypothetical protein
MPGESYLVTDVTAPRPDALPEEPRLQRANRLAKQEDSSV